MRLEGNRLCAWAAAVRRILFVLFLIQLGLIWIRLWNPGFVFGDARWPEGLLLVLMAATSLGSLSSRLPGQNVILASIIIVFIASAIHSLGGWTGIPFGPCVYTKRIGQRLFEPLPWAIPVLWLVVILTCRGVGRLILRPWRATRNYGFWLLGVSVLLVVLLDSGLEPFATQVKGYWVWGGTRLNLDWYSAPWVNFIGWALAAALILVLATPALLNKKPMKHPPEYHPLALWLLVNLLFVTGAALHHLWTAFGWTLSVGVVVTVLAARGAWPRGVAIRTAPGSCDMTSGS